MGRGQGEWKTSDSCSNSAGVLLVRDSANPSELVATATGLELFFPRGPTRGEHSGTVMSRYECVNGLIMKRYLLGGSNHHP
jgi:hypothetical protein